MTRTLLLLAVVAALAHLLLRHADFGWLALASKPVPVLCLAAIVWRAQAAPVKRWLVAGLLFSALGDLILAVPAALDASGDPSVGPVSFMAGLGAFLVAHLCYIAWFLALDRHWRVGRLVGPLLYGGILLAVLWPHLGAMLAPVLVYAAVITVMLWRALAAATGQGGQRGLAILSAPAAWGAILFVLSDSLIALNRFVEPLPMATLLIMLTYWAGQCGIFLTHRRFRARGA